MIGHCQSAYFSSPVDLEIMVALLKFTERLHSLGSFGKHIKRRAYPSAEVINDEANLREFVKNAARSVFHPVGTAAMLPRGDRGVVDSSLRVYGTSNLRVVRRPARYHLPL